MLTHIELPPLYAIDNEIGKNLIQQFLRPSQEVDVEVVNFSNSKIEGWILKFPNQKESHILVIKSGSPPNDFEKVLKLDRACKEADINGTNSKWIKHPKLQKSSKRSISYQTRQENVRNSWRDNFSYRQENPEQQIAGLRQPQIGALHAIHACWSVSDKPATVVMPTGTGKTETMLATLVSNLCAKILVVVPTDALRTQIATKFLSLGVLKKIGVLSIDSLYPIIGILKHKLKNTQEVDDLFEKCNVVVSTMNIVGQCAPEVQERIAYHCPYLFIDEAHHLGATTWKMFKKKFSHKRILQFTATPFRNDDKPIEGDIIYKYPLKRAQDNGYFKAIHFKPVREFDHTKADRVIAEAAIKQLRQDPPNHILMARVASVQRAKEVFLIYKQYTEFNPVQIHTGIKSKAERERVRDLIVNKQTRIVVCVDMLGEGFDLPELKIAVFHDIKKSLAVTLQLAGRFIRSRSDLGDATFIANIADVDVRDELKKLYEQDADWNFLLEQSSEKMVQKQIDLQKFIEGFEEFPESIPLQNLRPAMSTVVYKTKCQNWKPENFDKGILGFDSLEIHNHAINHRNNTLVIVTARKVPVDWARVKDIYNWDWELYILYWDKTQSLLFIHSSSNSGYYNALAEAVAGEVELIRGPFVFRCLSGIHRLKLNNVGLLEQLGRLIRYTMRAGADVESGLSEAQKRNVIKANIFGGGYELGEKASIGCSYKGRIWSRRLTNIKTFTSWCHHVGKKLIDENINPDDVLQGTLVPVPVDNRPRKVPFHIDWPEIMYMEPETCFSFHFDGASGIPLSHIDIRVKNLRVDNNLKFEIFSDDKSVELELIIKDVNNYSYSILGNKKVNVKYKNKIISLEDFFYQNPPVIWFTDGSSLEGNSYVELKSSPNIFPSQKIDSWNWDGVDIKKESQGVNKDPSSIQYRVIQKLKEGDYDIIFNDDGPGEAADVVSIKAEDQKKLIIEFYHCKYSQEKTPGSRVSDLYEVCGQALKSIHWKDEPELIDLFSHLLRREPMKVNNQEVSRFEKGDENTLFTLMEMSKTLSNDLRIFIIQPGLSKQAISRAQEELLGVTENYLMETYQLPFKVIANR